MNRKDFLINVWEKGIKPILLIGIIFFCMKFLHTIFTENGTERFGTVIIIGFGLLILTAYLIGLLFKSLSEKLKSTLPKSLQIWIRVIGKFLNYISPLILGMIIYYFWKEDWKTTAIVLGIVLIQRIVEIVKVERQNITKGEEL